MESDTKRIEAELAGLSAEIAKLTAESKKVEAETAKLAAETPKLSAEAARLQWENEHAKEGRRLEWLKALGTSSAFLVAIAALTGFAWTVYNGIREHKRVDQKRQDELNQSADEDFGSSRVPGSYVRKRSRSAPHNALPRRLTLCTTSQKPTYRGQVSGEMPRCGRHHDLRSDHTPALVLTGTS